MTREHLADSQMSHFCQKATAITALAAATITFTSAKILTIAMTVATTAAASRKRLIK